ncbi:unnamed protein product [Acanthoscelides obtectus]|uniref:Uncharacterized protein n=1 Tax=Acanthoscelides obtectus TaxID=200917 RepID=A0A9P0JXK5_ACAOB|nr:unnamed protein product [Acanthoscelides obtectus]CAK1646985.1 hypothetical protein AOBTE_LOCUS14987 [Acanthoscelides obtectus]
MVQHILLIALIVFTLLNFSTALECYVCDNQENNEGKCVTTIETCKYGEDVCLSEISWGSTPYWQQGALKQYYISKRCSTSEKCAKYRSYNMATCTHIWYQDWKCSECCRGDRCNYYIIVSIYSSITILLHLYCSFFKLYSYYGNVRISPLAY